MAARNFATSTALQKFTVLGLSAILLSSCASGGGGPLSNNNNQYRDAIDSYTSPASDPSQFDPIAAAAFWGTRYNRDHQDVDVAVKYSASLRKIGSVDEAVSVITKTAVHNADSPAVNLEAGKALIEAGRAFEAVRYLEVAVRESGTDWSAYSAYGVALDNIGEHDLAQVQYNTALSIAPGAIHVLNNKALSYALSGNLSRAENTLRTAATSNGADARIRQNLALVLALKGDLREAERLARSDLPPQVANQNIEYFQALLNQPAYWAEYAPDDFDAPSFDPAPVAPEVKEPTKAPTPLPPLREEKAPEPKEPNTGPIALDAATPVTNTSVEVNELSDAEETSTPAPEEEKPAVSAPLDLTSSSVDLKPSK